ncbi:MAG: hypothetical protein EZS28_034706, partial [Streblomastix strix]
TQTASEVLKPKTVSKRRSKNAEQVKPEPKTLTKRMKGSRAPDGAWTLQSREISVEISLSNRKEERADEDGSSEDRGKDWRIDIQRKGKWNGWKNEKIYMSMETDRE